MSFLFHDKILEFIPASAAQATLNINPRIFAPYICQEGAASYLQDLLLVEAVGQLGAWIMMRHHDFHIRPVAGLYGQIDFYEHAYVNETVLISTQLQQLDEQVAVYTGYVKQGDRILLRVTDAMGHFLAIQDFADPRECRAQFQTLLDATYTHPEISGAAGTHHLFSYDSVEPSADLGLQGIKYIQDYPLFAEHFPRKPVLPISILLQNNIYLGDQLLQSVDPEKKYRIKRLFRIKMRNFITPGSTLFTKAHVRRRQADACTLTLENLVDNKLVCSVFAEYIFM